MGHPQQLLRRSRRPLRRHPSPDARRRCAHRPHHGPGLLPMAVCWRWRRARESCRSGAPVWCIAHAVAHFSAAPRGAGVDLELRHHPEGGEAMAESGESRKGRFKALAFVSSGEESLAAEGRGGGRREGRSERAANPRAAEQRPRGPRRPPSQRTPAVAAVAAAAAAAAAAALLVQPSWSRSRTRPSWCGIASLQRRLVPLGACGAVAILPRPPSPLPCSCRLAASRAPRREAGHA